mmetsp:Transcript_3386/g.8835  ORF Transcript_3386/g.8835 Transcript_3386/m.8835 type:complete len:234 (+) Transcript_3386:51-752(+)
MDAEGALPMAIGRSVTPPLLLPGDLPPSLHQHALHRLLQVAVLVLLDHDVAAAEELAADVDLREGGPRGVLLQAGAQRVVLQDVHALKGHVEVVHDLHHRVGEAALRELRRALHEHNHLVLVHVLVQRSAQLGRQPDAWSHRGHPQRFIRPALAALPSPARQAGRRPQAQAGGQAGGVARSGRGRGPAGARASCRRGGGAGGGGCQGHCGASGPGRNLSRRDGGYAAGRGGVR